MARSTKRSAYSSEQVKCDAPISSLIAFLGYPNGWVRHHARECLVKIGKPSVPDLIEALENKNEDIRWEAAKALGQIGDSKAAPALVKVLRDKNAGVRWLAAEGLIFMGPAAMPPLLKELIKQPDSVWLHQSAHHVLHDLARQSDFTEQVAPVLKALEGPEPSLEVPIAARNLLDKIPAKRPRGKQQTPIRSQ